MSYSFVVKVEAGKPVVDEKTFVNVPDGKFMVNGHVPAADGSDWQYESLQVTRFDTKDVQQSLAGGTFKAR